MWAYYAGNFTGICIKYDMYKLLALDGLCWGNKPLKVIYDDERLVSAENTIDFGSRTSEGAKSLSTKHPDWMHEQEWRLLKREEFGKVYHTANAIDEVILGPRICLETAEQLKNFCKKQKVTISQGSFDGHVILFELANGEESSKRIRFEINDTKIDREFTYSL